MKTYIFTIIQLLIINLCVAQESTRLIFENKVHDFGVVKEETGTVSYTFNYKNTSSDSLKIFNVSTSCGCTAGEWKKTLIAPGEQGGITVTYTTAKRPGKFMQPVVVLLGEYNEEHVHLSIKGEVLPREKTKMDIYPIAIGNLRFINTHLTFKKIFSQEVKTDTVFIYNSWNNQMKLTAPNNREFLSIKLEPEVLSPDAEGLIIITYDASKRKDFGLIYDRLHLETNDEIDEIKSFHISAEIQEDFSKLSLNDLKLSPNMLFENETISFDTIKEGDVVNVTFDFTNTGASDLIIRKISTSCGCTASNVTSDVVKSGEKGSISVAFNSSRKRGHQRQTITLITNNPHRATVMLVLHGFVKPNY